MRTVALRKDRTMSDRLQIIRAATVSPRQINLVEVALRRSREALYAKSAAMQDLNIARSTEEDDFGPKVAYATQRLREANARVEAVNAELERICRELGAKLS